MNIWFHNYSTLCWMHTNKPFVFVHTHVVFKACSMSGQSVVIYQPSTAGSASVTACSRSILNVGFPVASHRLIELTDWSRGDRCWCFGLMSDLADCSCKLINSGGGRCGESREPLEGETPRVPGFCSDAEPFTGGEFWFF